MAQAKGEPGRGTGRAGSKGAGSQPGKKDPPTLRAAARQPVARIAVDNPLAHLDRPFDYLVPERLADEALPGVRVRVRFAGQLTDGFILERADKSDHPGRLAWLDRIVSPERVLTDEVAGLARAVADRYAGTLADVLRLAIPPRHATVESATRKPATRKPASGEPASAKPASAKPASAKPASGEPATRKPASGEPATRKPASGEPASGEPPAGTDISAAPAVGEAPSVPPALPAASATADSAARQASETPADRETTRPASSPPASRPAAASRSALSAALRSAVVAYPAISPASASRPAPVAEPRATERPPAERIATERPAAQARAPETAAPETGAGGPAAAVAGQAAAGFGPAADRPGTDRPGTDRPAADRPAADRPAAQALAPEAAAGAGAAGPAAASAAEPADAATNQAAAAPPSPGSEGPSGRPVPGPWARYPAGAAFLAAIAAGRPARAAWSALPGDTWPREIAIAVATAVAAGRGAIVVVPDARDLARVDAALSAELAALPPEPGGGPLAEDGTALGDGTALEDGTAAGEPAPAQPGPGERGPSAPGPGEPGAAQPGPGERHVSLTADLGPAERYRRWLKALRGEVAVVAGTRAAMFAPVRDLGLVVLWDEGDDLHADPHAPYPNAREVLALRAHRAGAAALLGGYARTAELAQLVASGWARSLEPERATIRAVAATIRPAADEYQLARDAVATTARLPSLALRTVRAGLADGPVLVQVPRRGYLASIACGRCRAPARCATCGGPLRVAGAQEVPDCGWCGALAGGWRCPQCGFGQVRAIAIGASRTAEELGRAFPGVKVRTSGGATVLPDVPDEPALIIATPGAEPVARYAAALLLDGWALLARPSLRSEEEALRRWMAAAALVRPDGTVLVHADASLPVVQALIRWDPATFAERTLADRAGLSFPPAVRMAAATGDPDAVASLLAALPAPPGTPAPGLPAPGLPASGKQGTLLDAADGPLPAPGAGGRLDILGPVPVEHGPWESRDPREQGEQVRALLRVPRPDGPALARALHAAQAARSARKEGGGVRVQMDPAELI